MGPLLKFVPRISSVGRDAGRGGDRGGGRGGSMSLGNNGHAGGSRLGSVVSRLGHLRATRFYFTPHPRENEGQASPRAARRPGVSPGRRRPTLAKCQKQSPASVASGPHHDDSQGGRAPPGPALCLLAFCFCSPEEVSCSSSGVVRRWSRAVVAKPPRQHPRLQQAEGAQKPRAERPGRKRSGVSLLSKEASSYGPRGRSAVGKRKISTR